MSNPKDTIPGMTWFSNANASASSVPTNLFAALSDPTDSHSLEELRAHLEDGGDMAYFDCPGCGGHWRDDEVGPLSLGITRCPNCGEFCERSERDADGLR